MTITVVGASGYLGKRIVAFFRQTGETVHEILRNDEIQANVDYGTVYYCAGVTIGFDKKPYDTVNAHVITLMNWLQLAKFDQLIYLSSTRLYRQMERAVESSSLFYISSDDIYNQTKLLAENLCILSGREVLILRPSNVISYDIHSPYFIWDLFRSLKSGNEVTLQETENSARDYVLLDDLLNILNLTRLKAIRGVYNVASGINICNSELIALLSIVKSIKNIKYGKRYNVNPVIMTQKISDELGYRFQDPRPYIRGLWNTFNGT